MIHQGVGSRRSRSAAGRRAAVHLEGCGGAHYTDILRIPGRSSMVFLLIEERRNGI